MYVIKPGMPVFLLRDVKWSEINAGEPGIAAPAYSSAVVVDFDNNNLLATLKLSSARGNAYVTLLYSAFSPGPLVTGAWMEKMRDLLARLREIEADTSGHVWSGAHEEIRRDLADMVNMFSPEPAYFAPGMQLTAAIDITMAMLQSKSEERDDGTVWIAKGTTGRLLDFNRSRWPIRLRVLWDETGGDEDNIWSVDKKWCTPFPYEDGQRVHSVVSLKLIGPDGATVKIEPGDRGTLAYFPEEDAQPLEIAWDKGAVNNCAYDEVEVLEN